MDNSSIVSPRFAMMLAMQFNEPNVDEFLSGMSRAQFMEWAAYYNLQPFGDFRADLRAARIAQAMAGGSLEDHMLFLEEDHGDMASVAALFE